MELSIERLWQQYGFTPNDKQREAILHTEGPLFLTAGPGSGKTRVLLWRTLNLLVFHGVKPEEIFLSTFTEKAAYQLKEGLQSLLGMVTNLTGQPYDISKMALGTVHSICQTIIQDRRFTADSSRRNAPIVMDELKQYFRLYNRRNWATMLQAVGYDEEDEAQRAINQYLAGRNVTSRHEAVQNCLRAFNRFSEECIDPAAVDAGQDSNLDTLLAMYQFYLESLRENPRVHTVDFSLLQQKAFEAIQAYQGAGHIFRHIIIDEYQDTNSIQEKIFFHLAKGYKNICVVGDDDQALYRFRGATVENLVEFPARCVSYLNQPPRRIDLDINYRSPKRIVDFYVDFIGRCDWRRPDGSGHFRVADKRIRAFHRVDLPAVACTDKKVPDDVFSEIASFVKRLKEEGKVQDYNQVAFLFPAMKGNTKVNGFKKALEDIGIPVYAPRSGRFLEVEEARAIYGLLFQVFGRPNHAGRASPGLQEFRDWTRDCMSYAEGLMDSDPMLKAFVRERRQEIASIFSDYKILNDLIQQKKWDPEKPVEQVMVRELAEATGLSEKAKRSLTSRAFINLLKQKEKERRPFLLKYIVNRVTSLDWSVLDLFYQFCGFEHFHRMFQLAEDGTDEGPICNLGLITQYLSRFMEEYPAIITAAFLTDDKFVHVFFGSYTYALFRLGESEYENKDDPFPKGRVPFLTIHQSKGLEFPVVVLGSLFKTERKADQVEVAVRNLLNKEGEPLDRINRFDIMRMFYVALSRAKNLVVLPHFSGRGQSTSEPFKTILAEGRVPLLQELDITRLPEAKQDEEDIGKFYSYTGDYLSYRMCPRRYMIFRKYGFVPSRSLTMFFGSLVHRTIEDLHHLLIHERMNQQKPMKV